MLNYIDGPDQNIINVLDAEKDYFDNFVERNGIKWHSEDRKNSILPLSKSYVGYIVTPLRKINLKPKYREISFEHIFRIYLYVYGYRSTDSAAVLDVSDANDDIDIAKLFFDSLHKNIHLGIIQTYSKQKKNLYEIKGKVNYSKTYLNYLTGKRKYVSTSTSKLSLNNKYNRLIATALRKLRHVKKHSPNASKYLMYLNGVSADVTNGSNLLESINFNSNTSRYKKTLLYAAMIIDKLDYEDVGNSVGTESFIINFDTLFEEFVVKVLKDIPNKRKFVTWQSSNKYAEVLRNEVKQESREYQPDILFEYIAEDVTHNYLPSSYAVLDVKNKAYGTFKNADVYQILTYAKILHSKKALLLYPSFSRRFPDSLALNPEIFDPSIVTGCYINIADSRGDDFLNSIGIFVKIVENVLMDIEVKNLNH